MAAAKCGLCSTLFQTSPDSLSFCPDCLDYIKAAAKDAETYQRRIDAGDVNIVPESDADRLRVRAAIRKRLDPSTRDSRYSHKR